MSTGNWHECVMDTDYEISDEAPHFIRRRGSNRNIALTVDNKGYLRCRLNGRMCKHHRIVALQFIHNDDPDNKTEVDHIDRVKTNNDKDNLRWCTRAENLRNRSNVQGRLIEFFDNLPDDAIAVTKYGRHTIENHYYSSTADNFYYHDQELNHYRKLCVSINNKGCEYVKARNVDGKQFKLCIIKFKNKYL